MSFFLCPICDHYRDADDGASDCADCKTFGCAECISFDSDEPLCEGCAQTRDEAAEGLAEFLCDETEHATGDRHALGTGQPSRGKEK